MTDYSLFIYISYFSLVKAERIGGGKHRSNMLCKTKKLENLQTKSKPDTCIEH